MSTSAVPTPPADSAETAQAADQALVPAPQSLESDALTAPIRGAARLPVEVDVAIPIRDFRVCNLLALEPGTVIESQWVHGDDVPLGARDVQLAWSEFEVVDTCLAVRLTRLA
jgi:flagellar motor switch/type III secretory pathway protein FliN